jgi:AbrB family looped-hinge helix DNA binding protein
MKEVGIIKLVDNLGRIVIPKEMRELFGIDNFVEVVVTQEGVLLRNPKYVLVEKKQNK